MGTAARGLGLIVSARLSDELAAEVDRVAAARGQSRGSWIADVLARAALAPEHDRLPIVFEGQGGHPDDQVRVTVRLNRSEIEAIDRAGAPMGLNRSQWIKRTLRWQLWDRATELRLSPDLKAEVGKLRKQVVKIGVNINQAVHAMNASLMPESSLELVRIAEPFLETCGELRAELRATRRALSAYVGAEVGYWTSAFRDVRP